MGEVNNETNNKNSILNSIKKLLGISEANTDFDSDVIIHINSVLMILNQLGIGKDNFSIEDNTKTWDDFLIDQTEKLNAVKTYVYLKVRIVFDPPSNGALMESLKETIKEYEWRLNVKAETDDKEV